MLRDALDRLLSAIPPGAVPLTVIDSACIAMDATRFIAPETFPAIVSTHSGVIITLHGLHNGRLIGSWVDSDGLQLNDWALDGTLFGPDDPDDFDLALSEDAPLGAAVAA